MGRTQLPSGHGLLIERSGNSLHTFFMRFSIDLGFVNKDGKVRHTVENLKPWKVVFAPLILSTDCLELPSGTIACHRNKVGDVIRVEA